MTSPTQRRHDELRDLLTEIRDRLPEPTPRLDALMNEEPAWTEPEDEARDHLHRLLAEESAAERRDEPVDTAPDVDPDEALARVAHMAFWGGRVMPSPDSEAWLDVARAVREHIYAEWNRVDVDVDGAQQDAIQARSDVERLTRERDDLRARIDDLIRERGQAIERAERAEAELRDEVAEHDKTRATVLRLTRERGEAVQRAEERQATSSQVDKARSWDKLVQHDIFQGVRPRFNQSWLDALMSRLDEQGKSRGW